MAGLRLNVESAQDNGHEVDLLMRTREKEMIVLLINFHRRRPHYRLLVGSIVSPGVSLYNKAIKLIRT